MLRSVLFLVFFFSSLLFSQSKFTFFVYAESSPINYNTYLKIKQIGFNGVVSLFNDDTKLYCDSLGLLMAVKKLIPTEYVLYQNYPNPFNPETTIKFDLPKESIVEMKLFDILGKEINLLINEEKPAGKYEVKINMNDFPSGIYFYQIKAGNYSSVKKMMFLK